MIDENKINEVREKLKTASENVAKVYNAGYERGKSENTDRQWNDFWDAFQYNGERSGYSYAFVQWDKECFKPKYDIRFMGASYAFMGFNNSGINASAVDLAELTEHCGITLDTSQVEDFSGMFLRACISRIGELDIRNGVTFQDTFSAENSYLKCLERIDKLLCSEKNVWYTSSFKHQEKLTHIGFDGTVASSIDLRWSKKLDKDSILSLLSALSSDAEGQTVKLSIDAVNAAFESAEGLCDGASTDLWLSVLTTKPNWTVELI